MSKRVIIAERAVVFDSKGYWMQMNQLHNFSVLVDNQLHCKVEGSQLIFQSTGSSPSITTNSNVNNDSNLPNNPDSTHNLKIISLNCRSIRSQSKIANLYTLLNEHEADIVIECEWLHQIFRNISIYLQYL